MATGGNGRLFVPNALILKLSDNAPGIEHHVKTAAPGYQHLNNIGTDDAGSRSEVLQKGLDAYRSYYKDVIEAMHPIDDLIPERYLFHITFLFTKYWGLSDTYAVCYASGFTHCSSQSF